MRQGSARRGLRAVVTHTDLDGVASAALIIKTLGDVDRVFFAQPHQLHAVLGKIPNASEVYVADLGVNQGTLEKVVRGVSRIVSSGGSVKWFDHHVWDEAWLEAVRRAGAEVWVERSTCGAGVVAKHLPAKGEGVDDVVSAACSVDLWVFNDWRGNFLARFVGLKEGGKWREYVARKLASSGSEIVDEEVVKAAEALMDRELRIYSRVVKEARIARVGKYVVAYYLKPKSEHVTSYIGNILLSRFNADIALICRNGSLSLRSRDVDVRRIAKALGGGGHPRAAGAPARPPLIIRLLAALRIKTPLLNWCLGRAAQALRGE